MQGETAVRHNGMVVAVRGSVVDMRFDGELPAIHSLLRAGDGSGVAIEVLAQRDARHVRGAEALTDADRKQVADAARQALATLLAEQESNLASPATVPPAPNIEPKEAT